MAARRGRIAIAVLLLASGCAAEPPAPAGEGVTASVPVGPGSPPVEPASPPDEATTAPAGTAGATDASAATATNDPSAPLDTPLCGRAARERNQAAAAIASDVMSGGGACVQTACFDPLTDTFIGADGYRHVCQ